MKYLLDDDLEDSDDKESGKWLDISSGKSSGETSYKSDGSLSKAGSSTDAVAEKAKASGSMSSETSDKSGISQYKSVDKSAGKESDGTSRVDKVGGKADDLGDKLSDVSDKSGESSDKSLEKSTDGETSTEKSDGAGDKFGKTSNKSGPSSDKSRDKSGGKSIKSEDTLKLKELRRLEKLRRLQRLPITINIGDSLKSRSGRDIMIDCEANGIPKPRIMWTKDGEDLTASDRITIFSNGSLLIKKATEEDTGKFSCTVINNKGVDTVSSRLKFVGKYEFLVKARPVHQRSINRLIDEFRKIDYHFASPINQSVPNDRVIDSR